MASSGLGAVTAGFKPQALMSAGLVVGGTVGNAFVRGFVRPMLPGMLQSGIPSAAVGVATAGIVGMLARLVAPRQAGLIFTGAMSEAVLNALKEVLPADIKARIGMADYLTQAQVSSARALDGYGLNDYLTQGQVSSARRLDGMGDEMGCGLDLMDEVQDF